MLHLQCDIDFVIFPRALPEAMLYWPFRNLDGF